MGDIHHRLATPGNLPNSSGIQWALLFFDLAFMFDTR